MLAGEPFSDHPRSVSPAIGSLLRSYNDSIDDRRRQDLRPCANKVVGSNGPAEVELARATRLAVWAATLQTPWWARLMPTRVRRAVTRSLELPIFAVDVIGTRVVGAIGRHTDKTHAAVLAMVDELLTMNLADPATAQWLHRSPSSRLTGASTPATNRDLANRRRAADADWH